MKTFTSHLAASVLFFLLCIAAAVPPLSAQTRTGTIEEIQPIENRGDDTSTRAKRGRSWGERLGQLGGVAAGAGLTMAGHSTAGLAVTAVAAEKGDEIGAAVGERIAGPGPATRYMVKVRLDNGRRLSLTQLREQVAGLDVGSRVTVEGSGDTARLHAAH